VELQTAAKGVDVVALVNISTEKWPPRQRTYFGSLAISSPQPGEAFAITPIHGCLGVMDLGDKRTMEYRITAREIAEDLAREINGDSGEGSYHGVFVAAGDAPTESELAEARRRLEGFRQPAAVAVAASPNGASENGFLVTITTSAAHGLAAGQSVTVAGVGVAGYDEHAKTAVLTRERDEAVRAAKGGSLLRRIARNAKWLAIGAAAGAIAAKAHR